jgi:hypothetical protein
LQRRFLPAAFSAVFLLIIIGIGCTKLDTTTLGSDLVTVDNVNTFADSLDVLSTTSSFNDSTSIAKNENHVIGNITTDLLFGKTESAIYVQFKPTFYPFYFGNAGDTVKNGTFGQASPNAGFDSAFICLSYKGAWGDTSSVGALMQKFEVTEISDPIFRDKNDTIRKSLKYRPSVAGTVLGRADVTPNIAKSKFVFGRGAFKDSVDNQIRIKLNTPDGIALAKAIFNGQDSSSLGPNNAFNKDSIFRSKFNGFAITVNSTGNTLFYVNLAETKSRLEFHYHKTKNGIKDTVVQSFQMYPTPTGSTVASSSANYIARDYSGTPLQGTTTDLNNNYLQTSPGTYVNVKIPGLTNYTNRIVHRAFLIVEQTPENVVTDNIYTPPPYLYLDLKDTVSTVPQQYKPLYFDLSNSVLYNPDTKTTSELFHPYPASNVDINTFGGVALKRYETSGIPFYRYEINLTRYVQHIATNGYRNYELRLYAPFNYYYPQYVGTQFVIPYFNPIALGRVRVGSGINTAHKMRLVVIYSKV